MSHEARCADCGGPLDETGTCGACAAAGARRSKTLIVKIPGGVPEGVAPEPSGDDLARVPLPSGWEIALEVLDGPESGAHFRVTRSRVLIGRGGCEVPLSDARVSRRHASLEIYGATCVLLKDLGSTNGTFVNGRRASSCQLQDGDEIQIGDTRMTITIGAAP
jgi:hypothetical protein